MNGGERCTKEHKAGDLLVMYSVNIVLRRFIFMLSLPSTLAVKHKNVSYFKSEMMEDENCSVLRHNQKGKKILTTFYN